VRNWYIAGVGLLKTLDEVFAYLNNDRPHPENIEFISKELKTLEIEISLRDLLQVLEKLCIEGLIAYRSIAKSSEHGTVDVRRYYITYEGIELLDEYKSYSRYLLFKRWGKRLGYVMAFIKSVGMLIVGAGLALGIQYITTRETWLQLIPQQIQEKQIQSKIDSKKDSIKTDSLK